MPMGYYLTTVGVSQPLGAAGMWYGMIIGLTIFSFLSIIRLNWIIKKFLRIKSF
jgi:MATE family multidrug resistance protein